MFLPETAGWKGHGVARCGVDLAPPAEGASAQLKERSHGTSESFFGVDEFLEKAFRPLSTLLQGALQSTLDVKMFKSDLTGAFSYMDKQEHHFQHGVLVAKSTATHP